MPNATEMQIVFYIFVVYVPMGSYGFNTFVLCSSQDCSLPYTVFVMCNFLSRFIVSPFIGKLKKRHGSRYLLMLHIDEMFLLHQYVRRGEFWSLCKQYPSMYAAGRLIIAARGGGDEEGARLQERCRGRRW